MTRTLRPMSGNQLGDRPEELPQVTARHLRRAEELCPRRLAHERARRRDSHRNRPADARFAVSNRLEADVRLAHATMRPSATSDFPTPVDLIAEQVQLYRAAAAGYQTLFPDAACTVDEALVDPWGSDLEDAGFRLSGGVGVPGRSGG